MGTPKILFWCLFPFFLTSLASSLSNAAEPAWWTQQKQDCGLDPSLAYNDWVAQGSPCNNGGNSGSSAEQIAEQQRAQQAQKDAENARIAREKAAAVATKTQFDHEKTDVLQDLKGSSPEDDGLKGDASYGNDQGLKDIGSKDNGSDLKDGPNSPPKPKKKKTLKIIHLVNKNCPCGGLNCNCLHPLLCGGTRKCDCMGVDCNCPKSVCKFAGTYNPCDGTVEDNDPGLGKVQRCRATCGCGYPKRGCRCSVDCKCSRK